MRCAPRSAECLDPRSAECLDEGQFEDMTAAWAICEVCMQAVQYEAEVKLMLICS